jgi:hypothetical protein
LHGGAAFGGTGGTNAFGSTRCCFATSYTLSSAVANPGNRTSINSAFSTPCVAHFQGLVWGSMFRVNFPADLSRWVEWNERASGSVANLVILAAAPSRILHFVFASRDAALHWVHGVKYSTISTQRHCPFASNCHSYHSRWS